MTQLQRPEDDVGSCPQEKGGAKKPSTEPRASARNMAKKPVSEILMEYAEQDEQEGHEIWDLASAGVEDEAKEDDFDDDSDVRDEITTETADRENRPVTRIWR